MKPTFFSDTHNRHREIKFSGGDVLVFCGDLTNRGELSQVEDFSKFVKNLDYNIKLSLPEIMTSVLTIKENRQQKNI